MRLAFALHDQGMDRPFNTRLDEVLSQVKVGSPQRTLFLGEGTGQISSYVAGWMAEKGMDVVLLDGANHFNPYAVSSFARKILTPPERLLKRIRLARAFTCYQMATLMGEKLASLLQEKEEKPWVILLGPITTFLDEDVPEREVRPLFERSLRRMEEMAKEGVPFLFFQHSVASSPFRPFHKNGMKELIEPRRSYLTRRLFQFSDLVWKISLEDQGLKMLLEKGFTEQYPNTKNQIPNKFQCATSHSNQKPLDH